MGVIVLWSGLIDQKLCLTVAYGTSAVYVKDVQIGYW